MSQTIGVCIQNSVHVKEHVNQYPVTVQESPMIVVIVNYAEVRRSSVL